MSGSRGGGDLPEVLGRELAPADSPAGRILAGEGPVATPRIAAGDGPEDGVLRPGRLSPDAFGASGPGVRERLEAVLRGEGCFVSTGHQPVLFLGPLYVLYKALTAIELARALEARWGRPVVPLFWIAADDHDWDEVGRTALLDVEGDLRAVELEPPEGRAARPVGPSPLGPGIETRIETLFSALPDSDFAPALADAVGEAYRPDATMTVAFAALLRSILGDRGYAWLDSDAPALKEAAGPLFREILEDPERALGAAERGARALEEAGFDPPITRLEEALPLFFDTGARRERLYVGDGGIRPGREGAPEPLAVWLRRLEEAPGSFSPNVASRPVLESYLLPIAATVLGPGETAYWSQLPPLFEAFDVSFPVTHPRAAWLLVERHIRRLLDRFGLGPDDLSDGGDAAAAELTESSRPREVERAIGLLRGAVGEGLSDVEGAIREALPGVKAAVGKARKGLFDAIGELESVVDRETRRRLEIEIGQIRRCAEQLFPDGAPQERVSSPFYYLARYGPALVDRLAEETGVRVAATLAGSAGDG